MHEHVIDEPVHDFEGMQDCIEMTKANRTIEGDVRTLIASVRGLHWLRHWVGRVLTSMDSFGVSSTTDGRGVGAVEAPLVLVLIAVDEAVVVLPNPPSVVLVSVDVDAGGNVLADCAALALRRHTPTALTTEIMSLTLHSDKPTPGKTHHQGVPAITKVHLRTLSSKLPASKLSVASSRVYSC